MMEFNESEIQLCKEIWDMGVKKPLLFYESFTLGCDNSPFVLDGSVFWNGDEGEIYQSYPGKPIKYGKGEWWPLWQIHDCIEWLREKTLDIFAMVKDADGWYLEWGGYMHYYTENHNTLLEALLMAIIKTTKEPKENGQQ